MIIFLVIALILIVVVFGVSSTMQSYASAQQAEATIQTAKATQMAVFGNVVVIVVVAIFFLAVLAAIIYVIRHVQTGNQVNMPESKPLWSTVAVDFAGRKQASLPAPHGELDHEVRFIELNPEQLQELEDDLWSLIQEDEEQL